VLAPLENAFFARAAALDAEAAYPVENIADLARVGALVAPLPRAFGGLGAGTEPAGAEALLALLRGIGRLHLPTGRLFEGHVNALKLIARYGTQGQMARAAQACRSGAPIGLWVTEQPPGLRLVDGSLEGGKIFCSGAGFTQAALVTARAGADDQVMLLVSLEGTRARPSHAAGRHARGGDRRGGFFRPEAGRGRHDRQPGGLFASAGVLGGRMAELCGDIGRARSAGGAGARRILRAGSRG
jgi:alkylation response protein AidB-like acyl-CoA dehydrogenase